MSDNIQARLYIRFILNILVFGVRRSITQVYDDISRGSSVARGGNRYVRRWKIE